MPLFIRVSNASSIDQPFEGTSLYPEYSYFKWSLTYAGQPVRKTAFHRMLFNEQQTGDPNQVAEGRSMWTKIHAGGSFTVTPDLNRLFEIKEPGVYTLQVS